MEAFHGEPEVFLTSIEWAAEADGELTVGVRRGISSRALRHTSAVRGGRVVAMATHPFAHWSDDAVAITPKASYLGLERDYAHLAREQLVCGCHVHVGISDPEEGIRVMNGARVWMPVMVALTGNSPFRGSTDTGYSSYRTEIFHRWPTAGSPEHFESRAEYDKVVDLLFATGTIDGPGRIYWDVRRSAKYPTIEFRATDVCPTVDAMASATVS